MKKLAWAASQRQNYIGERLRSVGTLNRFDIEREFGISAPQASIDIAYFLNVFPGVARYDTTLKSYVYLGEEDEKERGTKASRALRTALVTAVHILDSHADTIRAKADMPDVFDNMLTALKEVLELYK